MTARPPEELHAFLSWLAAGRFEYGRRDCLLLLADRVWSVCGVDPAAHLRGSYAGEDGARRVLEEAGGALALADAIAGALGLARTQAPRPGDPALILARAPQGIATLGAVKTAHGFASLAPRGLIRLRAPLVAAWSLA